MTCEADDPRIARQARAYGARAEAYRDLWAPVLVPTTISLLERLPLADAKAVLDVGTGVGAAIDGLRERAPAACVVGVDRSFGMLRLAPTGNPRAVMDAARLAFASGTFDVEVAAFMLFHLPDPAVGLRDLRRVARAGAMLGVATWGTSREGRAWAVWREELDAIGAPDRDPANRIANHDLMDTPDKLRSILHNAGFSSLDVRAQPLDHRPGLDGFVALQVRLSSREQLGAVEPEARAECIERATARLEQLPPDEFVDRSEVLLATATA